MRGKSQSGVTLIEILIAVTLLSLLTVGILVAMHLGLSTMEKTDARLVRNRRVVNARKIIESEIDGFTYSTAAFRPAPEMVRIVPFLQTEAQSMRFVSSYSLEDAWRGKLQMVALQVLPGEHNQGVRLILNETPYTGPLAAGQSILGIEQDLLTHASVTRFAPIEAGPQSFVLADHLKFCRFEYLEPRPQPPFQIWRPDWVLPQTLPLGIRIEMAPLDASATDLHVTNVTVPLNVNLTPGTFYADQL
ncbi:MAG TPA: prepilin-type N-terminal cleavage/methylation domain-containing protein [Bryobacteraceae bacterium]|jgi:prepilin-type N-terminal cleavage/methylation domain-containing protein|nr:prepilin-type N-terminal cleavage/methylation domain-containing protein [Bryobacteraceae bacterium]